MLCRHLQHWRELRVLVWSSQLDLSHHALHTVHYVHSRVHKQSLLHTTSSQLCFVNCDVPCSIVGFTSMSKELEPCLVLAFLNELFSRFDALVDHHGVHKVETAGDCYIVSAGVVQAGPDGFLHILESHDPVDSARKVLTFAKDMLLAAQQVRCAGLRAVGSQWSRVVDAPVVM